MLSYFTRPAVAVHAEGAVLDRDGVDLAADYDGTRSHRHVSTPS